MSMARCKWMNNLLAWEKQNYLDDTQNTLIGDGVSFKFVVSFLIPFNEIVFGTPCRSVRRVFVLYRNSQNVVLDDWFIHRTFVLDRQNSFTFNIMCQSEKQL